MRSEIVSLGVWGSKEIIYQYDFIPSSTLFRSMKLDALSIFWMEKTRYAVHIYRYALYISKKFESRSEEICTLQNLQISLRVFVQVALGPLVSDLLTF